jgi:hypothetical protein
VITGFNTDIEHDGVVYHVQTEDKGLDTPIILSLVYTGGTILASKRAPYEDLIASGFSDEALSERLKRQHKLICAAIHSGRINDLKKMSGRPERAPTAESARTAPLNPEVVKDFEVKAEPEVALPPPEEVIPEPEAPVVEEEIEFEFDFSNTQEWRPPPKEEEPAPVESEPVQESESMPVIRAPEPAPYTIHDPRRQQKASRIDPEVGLVITLLDDEEFYADEDRTVRVLITDYTGEDHKPLSNVAVSVKILGTTFRPLIYSVKTEKDGVAILETQIPQFTSGRAAVLIRAVLKERFAEVRRVIHPKR